MFEDAFKGNLWAGGRVPNVMAGLQRAILDGVLDLRSIEAHRLVCLSHNLHVKDLRQTRYFWSFTSTWHAFQALLQPSALAGGADLQRTHTELAIPGGPLSFLMARAAVHFVSGYSVMPAHIPRSRTMRTVCSSTWSTKMRAGFIFPCAAMASKIISSLDDPGNMYFCGKNAH